MASVQAGRVCMKVAGREAGGYCVVLNMVDKRFAMVTGPKALTGIKRRKSNITHLEPTQYVLDIPENANDEQVVVAMEKAGLVKKFGLKMPSAAQLKAKEKKQEEKVATKSESKPEVKKDSKKKEKK